MVEELFVFDKEYIDYKDIACIEEKIKDSTQGKYVLALDFSKAKSGVQTDFYMAIIERFQKAEEKKCYKMLKENIIFIFESKESKPYTKFEQLYLDHIVQHKINDETE